MNEETKKELTTKINDLFRVIGALLGIVIIQSVSVNSKWLLIGFFIGGFAGWLVQPYNRKGELRY